MFFRLAAASALAGLAIAQADAPLLAADGLPLIAAPAVGVEVSGMRGFSQGLTADGRGRIWCLVAERPANGEPALFLHGSDDGRRWRRVARAPCANSDFGVAVGARGSDVLHVAWSASYQHDKFASAVYQRFDTAKEQWLGEPELLQRGTGNQDQYSVADLAVAADQSLVCVVMTHRIPPQPPWPSGWSSGILTRAARAAAWRGPFPINGNSYGCWANLQLRDGHAHATYRTTPNRSLIAYRSYALADERFDQEGEDDVSAQLDGGRQVANASSLLVDPFGGRTVVYPVGGQQPGKGRLMVAYSADGEAWRAQELVDDPPLQAGNVGHEHFALVRGPGRQAIALYSKVGERHRVLYRRILEQGAPLEAEHVVATSDRDGAFHRISAMRDARLVSGVWAIVSGDKVLGVRAVLAPRPLPTRWQ